MVLTVFATLKSLSSEEKPQILVPGEELFRSLVQVFRLEYYRPQSCADCLKAQEVENSKQFTHGWGWGV